MKVTTIKRISLDGFVKMEKEEDFKGWSQKSFQEEEKAVARELQEAIDEARDYILVNGVRLYSVDGAGVFGDSDAFEGLTGLILRFLDKLHGIDIACWRVPVSPGSYIEVKNDGHIHISYKRGA